MRGCLHRSHQWYLWCEGLLVRVAVLQTLLADIFPCFYRAGYLHDNRKAQKAAYRRAADLLQACGAARRAEGAAAADGAYEGALGLTRKLHYTGYVQVGEDALSSFPAAVKQLMFEDLEGTHPRTLEIMTHFEQTREQTTSWPTFLHLEQHKHWRTITECGRLLQGVMNGRSPAAALRTPSAGAAPLALPRTAVAVADAAYDDASSTTSLDGTVQPLLQNLQELPTPPAAAKLANGRDCNGAGAAVAGSSAAGNASSDASVDGSRVAAVQPSIAAVADEVGTCCLICCGCLFCAVLSAPCQHVVASTHSDRSPCNQSFAQVSTLSQSELPRACCPAPQITAQLGKAVNRPGALDSKLATAQLSAAALIAVQPDSFSYSSSGLRILQALARAPLRRLTPETMRLSQFCWCWVCCAGFGGLLWCGAVWCSGSISWDELFVVCFLVHLPVCFVPNRNKQAAQASTCACHPCVRASPCSTGYPLCNHPITASQQGCIVRAFYACRSPSSHQRCWCPSCLP